MTARGRVLIVQNILDLVDKVFMPESVAYLTAQSGLERMTLKQLTAIYAMIFSTSGLIEGTSAWKQKNGRPAANPGPVNP